MTQDRKCPFSAESIGRDIRIGANMKTEIDLLDEGGRVSRSAIVAINSWLEESYLAGERAAKQELRDRMGL